MSKIVKLQSLVAKCYKIRKIYSLAKFANFVFTCGNLYHFFGENLKFGIETSHTLKDNH